MDNVTRILIVEDNPNDYDLAQREIRKSLDDCEIKKVETEKEYLAALESLQPDVILSDYGLPNFNGMQALKLAQEHAVLTPFIIWTGTLSEETAAECMKAGANNYILKENITRLGPAIRHALEERQLLLEHKQAEDKLRRSEANYRALAEHSLQGITIFQEHRIAYVNAAMCTIMGYAAKELMEMSDDQIRALTHPDDRAMAPERATKRQMGKPVSALNDLRIVRKDGTIRWVQTSTNSIEYDGQPALLLTSVDMTERRRAEEELKHKNDDLRLLNTINNAVARGQSFDSIVVLLSSELKRIFSAVGSTIYMLGPENRFITMEQYSFSPEIERRIEKLIGFKIPRIQIPIKEGGHFHNALDSKRSAITSDPQQIQDWIGEFTETTFLPPIARTAVRKLVPHVYKLLHIRSTIIVPLISQDAVIGFLDVSSADLFTQSDLKRIENIGEQLTSLIQRHQVNERVSRSEEFLQGIQNSLSTHLAILDSEATIIQVNSAWCDFGQQNGLHNSSCCVGVNYLEVCEAATGSDAQIAKQVATGIREILAGKQKELSIEYPCHSPSEKRWFTVHITCFDDGKQKSVILAHENVTARKLAEEAVREEREKIQGYLNIAGVIMLALDMNGTVTLINQKGCEILGCSHDEIMGKNWIDTFIPESIRDDMQDVFHKLIQGDVESSPYYENPVLTKNGEQRMIAWHNTLVRDENGMIITSLSSGEDITERRRAEDELRTSEERFRQLAGNIQEVFWMTDAISGQELYISPASEKIWGRQAEILLHEPNAFIDSILPEDRDHVKRTLKEQRNGRNTNMEYRVTWPDGSVHWIWDRAFPILDETGRVVRLAGIAADITERKQAELAQLLSQARYRDLFDNSPVSLWEEDYSLVKKKIESLQETGVTDLNEYLLAHPEVTLELASLVKIVDVNQASMKLYKVSQKEDLIKGLTEFISDETLQQFRNEINGLINTSRFEWEGKDRTLDGREVMVMVNGSIPPGYEEDWSKVIVSINDITERKQVEERLRASEERYHNLFKHLMAGFALHEIITDDQGKPVDYRFLEINPAFEQLTGLTAENTVGRCVNEILPIAANERFISIYGQVALTGQPVQFEDYSPALGRYYAINAYSPRHGQFAVTFSDITERRKIEVELRKLSRAVEQSASTIVITDTTGNIEYVNPKFTEVTGYTVEEALGQNPRILKSGHSTAEAYKLLWQTITSGAEWRGELYNKKKNGDLFWEQATISPIQNENGEITHFVAVKEDITQRKQSELEIEHHLAELEALYENGLAVGQLLEPKEIGSHIIQTFTQYLSWHHVAIRLLHPETDNLELIAFNQPGLSDAARAEIEARFSTMVSNTGQGLSGWAMQSGRAIRTGNVHTQPQYVDTHEGIMSGLYMPLKVGNRITGCISVESDLPNAFTLQDERLLATLANQAAIAFENARLYQAAQLEISERRRAQDALRESETHYRQLANSITDILFELDQDLRYTHWNKASEIFSGIPAQDAVGRLIGDVFGNSNEQLQREELYRVVLKERQAKIFETAVIAKGQKRYLEVSAYPSATGVSVVAKDITERRLTESILQKRFELMEYAARHSLEEVMQRTIDEVSDLTESHIGFLHFVEEDQKTIKLQAWSSETLQSMTGADEIGMHYPVDSAGVWADAVRQRQPIIHNDYESLPDKKGLPEKHVPVVREMVVPIIRTEKIAAVLGIGNKAREYTSHDLELVERFADYAWDIAERKQMENALAEERNQLAQRVEERTADLSRANSNLARALRVKDEFLANMSHELRTPLNAILGLSESLGEQVAGPLNEKQQKYLSIINESGHHLLSLINDILDLAKIEAGQISLDINKVDVNSVCQASLRMIKQLAQRKNQEVRFTIEPEIGLMWADERRLKQMIVNLLSNAVKFTPDSSELGLEVRGDREGNKISISVWDRGMGISNSDIQRLFKPFIQLDSGLAREATGTGLGLALVSQMAKLHGGSVTVESQPGQGSQFTIMLPWEPALAGESNSRLRTTGKFLAIKPNEVRPTILLIEDTQEVVMMLVDYLEMAGFNMVTAQDGIDGLTQAKIAHPDLILMDIQMPRMDGFEATKKLRGDPEFKETPIIALTALAMPNDRQLCLDAGMNEYLSKPVNLKALAKTIKAFLYEAATDQL